MKAAFILSLAAMLISGSIAAPAKAQVLVDTSNIFIDPNAPPNYPLSAEQDEFITSIKDLLTWREFNHIAESAHITKIKYGKRIVKPIVQWTQRDLRNFDKEASNFDRYLNELHTGYLFSVLFGAEGGDDGDGDE